MSRPAEAPLRIIIADDQASVREGLVLLLGLVPGIEVTAAAADGQQALDLVAEHLRQDQIPGQTAPQRKTDIKSHKSANLRAVGCGRCAPTGRCPSIRDGAGS
jgi:CheY-like chemotaxis protein